MVRSTAGGPWRARRPVARRGRDRRSPGAATGTGAPGSRRETGRRSGERDTSPARKAESESVQFGPVVENEKFEPILGAKGMRASVGNSNISQGIFHTQSPANCLPLPLTIKARMEVGGWGGDGAEGDLSPFHPALTRRPRWHGPRQPQPTGGNANQFRHPSPTDTPTAGGRPAPPLRTTFLPTVFAQRPGGAAGFRGVGRRVSSRQDASDKRCESTRWPSRRPRTGQPCRRPAPRRDATHCSARQRTP